ncbi:restriction endonuclease subunit S [Lactobacillus sp. UMNPBX4]|uniref:restriction endonuclease subunit S n=1 Tax=Lactobacillus sp. UMNPBX4 TaxID=2042043 RepID=UPI000BEEDAA0|nr:restriction endonuclease subunit S [Lactobacillus sp. UMNPBX4]PEH06697.1 hypothetical protein CP355_02800 [Lactobacillus sp. UMNPBX4]
MTPEQLRASILQYAMEGKLVKQDPNDEPASELIQKIKSQRTRLAKESKIKKSKKLPLITDDEKPFDIPDNWEWARLNDLSENVQYPFADGPFGSNLKKEHYTDKKEVRIIQLSNIGERGWRDANHRYTTFEHLKDIKRSEVEAGDIVIAKMMPAGRAIIVPQHLEKKFVLSSDAVKFVPNKLLYKDFLYFAINSSVFKSQVDAEVQGITRKRTSLTKVKKYILPIPPLEEQKRIVAKIKKLMPLVDEYAESYNRLQKIDNEFEDKLKQSVLRYAMEGKLVKQDPSDEPASELIKKIENKKAELIKEGKIKKSKKLPAITDDEKPFDIPDSWEWVRLESISILKNGKTPKKQDISFKGKYPYFKVRDMNNNRIYMKNVKNYVGDKYKKQLMPKDTIIFPKNGGAVLTAKKRILVENSLVDLNTSGIIPLSPTYYKYIFYLFSSLDIRNYVKGTALPTIDSKKLKATPVPLPPLKEQKRIVAKIQKLQDSISSLSK